MTEDKVIAAMVEANRFVLAVERLREVRRVGYNYGNPREQGAVRRASLDLTRALADLRKP